MFTRFANPHALDSKIEIVSRDALTSDDAESTIEAVPDDALLTELDRLVKRSLGDLDISEGADENSRKKRRKIDKEKKDHAESSEVDGSGFPASIRKSCPFAQCLDTSQTCNAVAFRLVSRTLPPREIELELKTMPTITYVPSKKAACSG